MNSGAFLRKRSVLYLIYTFLGLFCSPRFIAAFKMEIACERIETIGYGVYFYSMKAQ